jgi:hypothetical protein
VKEKSNEELNPVLQSMIRIDLLAFFQANPHTRDTIDGLALRLHRPREQVAAAAHFLSNLGVLERSGTKNITIYRLRNGDLIKKYFQQKGVGVFESGKYFGVEREQPIS